MDHQHRPTRLLTPVPRGSGSAGWPRVVDVLGLCPCGLVAELLGIKEEYRSHGAEQFYAQSWALRDGTNWREPTPDETTDLGIHG